MGNSIDAAMVSHFNAQISKSEQRNLARSDEVSLNGEMPRFPIKSQVCEHRACDKNVMRLQMEHNTQHQLISSSSYTLCASIMGHGHLACDSVFVCTRASVHAVCCAIFSSDVRSQWSGDGGQGHSLLRITQLDT